jgi:hypothetical protein
MMGEPSLGSLDLKDQPVSPPIISQFAIENKWPIEIVDLAIHHGDFPVRKLLVYQRVAMFDI